MVLDVPPLPKEILLNQNDTKAESSEVIRTRVLKAYNTQLDRQGKSNDQLNPDEIEKWIALNQQNTQLLADLIDKLQLSARAFHRVLKVARTIADIDGSTTLEQPHLMEAISYRRHNG